MSSISNNKSTDKFVSGAPQSDFVLVAVVDGQEDKYYAIDPQSGYPDWTTRLFHAHIFKSSDIAHDMAVKISKELPHVSGTTQYPSREIHSALGLCNTKLKGAGVLVIKKVQLSTPVVSVDFAGEIKNGTVQF